MRILISVNGTHTASLDGPGYFSARFNVEESSMKGRTFELQVLAEEPEDIAEDANSADEPVTHLLTDKELARELLRVVKVFESRLAQLVRRAENREPPEELATFKRAAGQAFSDLGERLLFPLYRRHKELTPGYSPRGKLPVT
jgi:hypothetical protein